LEKVGIDLTPTLQSTIRAQADEPGERGKRYLLIEVLLDEGWGDASSTR
jgi:hypothetical protein